MQIPIRAVSGYSRILDLIRESFAYMDERIDPPSSMHDLTSEALAAQEVWVIEGETGAPLACMVLTEEPESLYLGKLAVCRQMRGQGIARTLVEHAADLALARGKRSLRLQVRVELTENQRAFGRMGFVEIARTAHPGFDRATSVTMLRALHSSP